MCSQLDHPPYEAPQPAPPRTYVLSGSRRESDPEPASVALAVLGEMLEEVEAEFEIASSLTYAIQAGRLAILREARDRVAAAEARL